MAQRSITKPTVAAVIYPVNHRATIDSLTIQNLTSAALGVKITAGKVQRGAVVYSDPASGVLSIAANAVGTVTQPCTALELSGTGTGTIEVVEEF